jgi:hypothetical protein
VQFALETAAWGQMKSLYFTGCPHFTGLLFTGFIVLKKSVDAQRNHCTQQKCGCTKKSAAALTGCPLSPLMPG